MPLTRKLHWAETYFHDFLVENADKPFQWGSWDCSLFCADAIKSITDVDVAVDFRDQYTTEFGALKTIKRVTGGTTVADAAQYCAEQFGLVEYEFPLLAKRGDLVVAQNGDSLISAVVDLNGRHIISVSENGLMRLPITNVVRAWSV